MVAAPIPPVIRPPSNAPPLKFSKNSASSEYTESQGVIAANIDLAPEPIFLIKLLARLGSSSKCLLI
nr:MAG TPA: hypothetical protein [Caudoviricetes sp.]